MPSFEELLKDKNKRLEQIPLNLLTVTEREQKRVLSDVISKLNALATVDGQIKIDAANLREITKISDELKDAFLTEDYLNAVNKFAGEFQKQAVLNNQIIKAGFGSFESSLASKAYIDLAKKSVIEALVGSPIDKEFIKPIQGILEAAVINGSSPNDLITNITTFVQGDKEGNAKILKYVKQISYDSFAIADASYTSIVADFLEAEWFYYSGSEVDLTRCFCKKRYGNYYHYKEIESWGNGENLGDCKTDNGLWDGANEGTNSTTIYSYRGGYRCGHYFIAVSEETVPESDIERTKSLGYID